MFRKKNMPKKKKRGKKKREKKTLFKTSGKQVLCQRKTSLKNECRPPKFMFNVTMLTCVYTNLLCLSLLG
jgi:hypothetical protein